MDQWIEHPTNPHRLLLAWEPPLREQDRARWAVGELTSTRIGAQFRYFDDHELRAHNNGRGISELREAGYLGYPAFGLKNEGPITEDVLSAFLRRLPPAQRSDYSRYLEHFRLRSDSTLTPFALLANTAAKLPSDGFSLIDPLDELPSTCEFVIEIVGIRHQLHASSALRAGYPVKFVPEPNNAHDANAVRIQIGDAVVGYVNRLQAANFGRWLDSRHITGQISRVNGSAERPRAFIFVMVRPSFNSAAA